MNKIYCFFFILSILQSSYSSAVEISSDTITISSDTINIPISGFIDPVVIAGIPTNNDPEPGVVSISNVTTYGFDIKFKEWPYLDGVHGEEQVSYLVIERGRHLLNDGSVWEAGTFTQKSGNKQIFFKESFKSAPYLFLSGQTNNETDTYALRGWSVTNIAFSSNLKEQEAGNSHGNEDINYLAVSHENNTGTFDSGTAYKLFNEANNHSGFKSLFGKIFLEEEQSKDSETDHVLEVMSILTIGNKVFATDNTKFGNDTLTIRLEPLAEGEFTIEPGTVTGKYNNIALIGTNGLTEDSYTASDIYSADSAAGAFDGYNISTKINSDSSGKIKRGIWLTIKGNQEHWLQTSFTKQAYITSLRFFLYSAASTPGMGVKDVTLQISNDNVNFVDHESFSVPKSLEEYIHLTRPAIGQYIRLKIHTNHGHTYTDIGELEYYGGFINSSSVIVPPPIVIPKNIKTCQTIKDEYPNSVSDFYEIDPDGDDGFLPFSAYCEMEINGGGWTLVANHIDGLDSLTSTESISLTNYSVLNDQNWQSIKNNITTGMMFLDENNKLSYISKSKLLNGNCQSTSSTSSLVNTPVIYDIGVIWQDEKSGCSLTGTDYSFIALSTKFTSRGDGYLTIGASLYQHNIKFDIWPYNNAVYSGSEQNQLLYFIK